MSYQIYFQKASLKSYLSLQVLVGVALFLLSLLEGALATFDSLLFSVPYITFTIFFILTIFYPMALPLSTIFVVTVIHDIFFASLQHSQTFAILLSLIIIKRLVTFPEQRDFLEIWQAFGLAMGLMIFLQSALFMMTEFAFLNLQGLFFQFGVSLLLYPFMHAVVMRLTQAFVEAAQQ